MLDAVADGEQALLWGGRGAASQLFRAVWGLGCACWSVQGRVGGAKGAVFGGAGGPSATVSLRPFRTPPLRSRHQSPHAVCSCARFRRLISAAGSIPHGTAKSFFGGGRVGGVVLSHPMQRSARLLVPS